MKKIAISALLLASILLTTACASSGDASSESSSGASTDVVTSAVGVVTDVDGNYSYVPDVKDYGGYEFRFVNFDEVQENAWNDIPDDIFIAEESGDLLGDSVYRRNKAVEEALNITISSKKYGDLESIEMIEQTVLSGTDEFDAVSTATMVIPSLLNRSLLADMNTMDFDFDAPWWDKNSLDSLLIGGKLFAVTSDITYFDKLAVYVTFFNRKIAENYDVGNLYELASSGEWTVDKMFEIGDSFSQDLDNNGAYDINDSFGVASQNDAFYIFFNGGGLHLCDIDSDGEVRFTLEGEKEINALQKIYGLLVDKQRFFNRQEHKLTNVDAINMFNEDKVMFLIRPIQSLFMMRNMDSDFGILPIPKLYEGQEGYGTAINNYCGTMLCMPISIGNPERSADIMQYMAFESYKSVIDPFYETILGNKLIRDEGSSEMLDIAFGSRIYDTGLIWNFGGVNDVLLNNRSTDVASLIATQIEKVSAAIEEFNEMIAD